MPRVDGNRRADIGEPLSGNPRRDTGARGGIWVARLPDLSGEGLGEADDVLAGARADFKRNSALWKDVLQHFADRSAVARGGGRELPPVASAATVFKGDGSGRFGLCHAYLSAQM